MAEGARRKLTTILAADVAGYSRLAGADEEGTMHRLRALRAELIDPAIAAHRGRVFKTTGDGLLVEFASVVDAARCAVDVQRAMARRNDDFVPEKRIEFRVGIHLGDVLVEADGDLLGDGVNIAARLEGLAEPGGICLSNAAYEQVRDRIDAAFTDLGEQSLKNIARPLRVYAIPPFSPSPPRRGGEGRDEVGDSGARHITQAPHQAALRAASPPPAGGGRLGGGRLGGGLEAPPRLSIVVLPFANIGGDPEQEYFVDGVTESLTTDLSRISGSFVIGRNTAFTYKGKAVDLKQIGRDLNVRYVLEGSVQRGGNRLRVNVQLIDAETGNHLWAERFDKPVADLFDMQDEIVARLANQLNTELVALEARRAERSPHPDSMDLYFQGQAWVNKGLNPENLARARVLFERAFALDPTNIEALVGKAWMDGALGGGSMSDERQARLATAEATLAKALSLVPGHAAAHMMMGYVQIHTNRGIQGIAECERALALDRNLASAHAIIGQAKYYIGRGDETEAHVQEAFRLSPRDSLAYGWMFFVGAAKLQLGRNEEAVTWLRRSIETNRNLPLTNFFLAAALAHLGRQEEARAATQAGLAFDPAFTIRRVRAGVDASGDSPDFRAQRQYVIDGMRLARVPEG